jgi:short-subunit dehydrogenase
MSYWKDKVVWVTGASSGIGEALARTLADQGAKLVLSSRRKKELLRIAEETNLGEDQYLILPLDLGKYSGFEKEAKKVIQKFGRLDVLIHNGGISQRSLAEDSRITIFEELIRVNYLGTVALTLATLPIFLKQGFGHFAVVSSIVGKIGTPMRSGYAASKHALHGFFDSLRAEVNKKGISVLLVCPGYIRTQVSVNALTGSGEKQGTMDEAQAKGMDPLECARQILSGIENRKMEIIVAGPRERLAVWLKRLFPGILARVLETAKVT